MKENDINDEVTNVGEKMVKRERVQLYVGPFQFHF